MNTYEERKKFYESTGMTPELYKRMMIQIRNSGPTTNTNGYVTQYSILGKEAWDKEKKEWLAKEKTNHSVPPT